MSADEQFELATKLYSELVVQADGLNKAYWVRTGKNIEQLSAMLLAILLRIDAYRAAWTSKGLGEEMTPRKLSAVDMQRLREIGNQITRDMVSISRTDIGFLCSDLGTADAEIAALKAHPLRSDWELLEANYESTKLLLTIAKAENEKLRAVVEAAEIGRGTAYDLLKHGDREHMAWLKQTIDAIFANFDEALKKLREGK